MTTPNLKAIQNTPGATTAVMAEDPVVAQVWMDIMAESALFVAGRLREDLAAQQALLKCKTPGEIVKLQSDFLIKAIEQYAEEAQRLSEVMAKASHAIATQARPSWSRAYDDVPL